MRMRTLTWIIVLIQAGAVKTAKPKGITRKMSRYPVKDHADPLLMHIIHKIHEILRCAIAGSRCIIPSHLISPGTVERMLHDGKQLDVGIAHLFHIICDHRSQLAIIIEDPVILRLFKGTQMKFVNKHRLVFCRCLFAFLHPAIIAPSKVTQVCDNGCCIWTKLRSIGIRVSLQICKPAFRLDLIFVNRSARKARHK